MFKISIENDLSSISLEEKKSTDERWTPLFSAFTRGLRAMGYQVGVLETFLDVFIEDEDSGFTADPEEFREYLKKFGQRNFEKYEEVIY